MAAVIYSVSLDMGDGSLGYCCSGCQKCGSELRSIMTSQRTVKKQLITLVGPVSIYNEMPWAESSLRMISAPALKAFSLPLATARDKGAMPQLVQG